MPRKTITSILLLSLMGTSMADFITLAKPTSSSIDLPSTPLVTKPPILPIKRDEDFGILPHTILTIKDHNGKRAEEIGKPFGVEPIDSDSDLEKRRPPSTVLSVDNNNSKRNGKPWMVEFIGHDNSSRCLPNPVLSADENNSKRSEEIGKPIVVGPLDDDDLDKRRPPSTVLSVDDNDNAKRQIEHTIIHISDHDKRQIPHTVLTIQDRELPHTVLHISDRNGEPKETPFPVVRRLDCYGDPEACYGPGHAPVNIP